MVKNDVGSAALEPSPQGIASLAARIFSAPPYRSAVDYLGALAATALCTAVAFPFYPAFNVTNIAMLYVLGTTVVALRLGRGPAVFMSVLNILALDYYFIPPLYSLDIEDTSYIFTLGVMLMVALIVTHLLITIQQHRDRAEMRERRTAMLYAMSRELSVASDADVMAVAAVQHLRAVFQCSAAVLLVAEDGGLTLTAHGHDAQMPAQPRSPGVDIETARDVVARGERRIADGVYLPLRGSQRIEGVVVVRLRHPASLLPDEQLALLDAFAVQLSLALQRVRLAKAAEQARISADRVLLSNTLLASISHDLRTPLSAIAGAGGLIAQPDYALNVDRLSVLGQLIERKAQDMSQLLSNVLQLAKMEFGYDSLRTDWHAVEDLVSHSLRANQARLAQHRVAVHLTPDLPSVLVEASLVVQILNNLLQNATKYTPPGTMITLSATVQDTHVLMVVADDGPGLPPGDPERLFDKFHRGRAESNVTGVGLGLSICRAAARLLSGEIRALENPGGGARFELSLPVQTCCDADSIPEGERASMLA